jgi:hypothetical protein
VRIVPVDGSARERLAAARLGYQPVRVASPGGAGLIETITTPVIWLADEKQDPDLVYRIVRAAFHPRNAAMLSPDPADQPAFRLARVPADFVVPVHPGAAKYFAEAPRPSN